MLTSAAAKLHVMKMRPETHVDQVLVEPLPQVVQEGGLAGVGVQQDQVLDAHAVPGCQGALHVAQDPVAPLLQALKGKRAKGSKVRSAPVTRGEEMRHVQLSRDRLWGGEARSRLHAIVVVVVVVVYKRCCLE